MTAEKKPAKKPFIKNYRELRRKLNLSQTAFWAPLGVRQSSSSRYEKQEMAGKRPNIPPAVETLASMIYVEGQDIDVRNYRKPKQKEQ